MEMSNFFRKLIGTLIYEDFKFYLKHDDIAYYICDEIDRGVSNWVIYDSDSYNAHPVSFRNLTKNLNVHNAIMLEGANQDLFLQEVILRIKTLKGMV